MEREVQSIPFRTDPVISGDHLMWIAMVTVGLLMLVAIVLLQLRRRGWLDAWSRTAAMTPDGNSVRWQVRSQRISRRTTVHTLHREGCQLLVVESLQGVTVTLLPSAEGASPVGSDGQANES